MRHLLFVVAWIVGAANVGWRARLPDQYLIHVRGITEPQAYPLSAMGVLSTVMAVQMLFHWLILRPGSFRHSWKRALLALVFATGSLCFFAIGAMHAPPYYLAFMIWQLALVLAIALLLLWAGLGAFRSRGGG